MRRRPPAAPSPSPGAYGGEGEPFVKIPSGVVLTIAGNGSLVLREEDAAAALQSQGTLRVEAGGSLEFLGQTYIGGADSVLHLTAGAVTIGDFRPADGKFRITLAENAAAEIPAGQELKLTLPLETGSGLDLTVSAGASPDGPRRPWPAPAARATGARTSPPPSMWPVP